MDPYIKDGMQPAHLFCHADCLSYLKAVNLITFSRAPADLRVKLIDYYSSRVVLRTARWINCQDSLELSGIIPAKRLRVHGQQQQPTKFSARRTVIPGDGGRPRHKSGSNKGQNKLAGAARKALKQQYLISGDSTLPSRHVLRRWSAGMGKIVLHY
jgi:hypothetical protein